MNEHLEKIILYLKALDSKPFRARAFEKAAENLVGLDVQKKLMDGTIQEVEGVGQGVAKVLEDFYQSGTSALYKELHSQIPEGFEEIVRVPGLGPKKALTLSKDHEIRSLSELEYACRENRLLLIKGFGEKTQESILKSVQFLLKSSGAVRLDEAMEFVWSLALSPGREERIQLAGQLGRQLETISEISWITDASANWVAENEKIVKKHALAQGMNIPIRILRVESQDFGRQAVRLTGSGEFLAKLDFSENHQFKTEHEYFERQGLPYLSPELRETPEALDPRFLKNFSELVDENSIKGVFHNHTNWSDGKNSLDEMVCAARNLGYQYIGISDHSQSAFYAQGLGPDRLKEQREELERVREKYADIRIFWGIESDILKDGKLDYSLKELESFDFVVASVHSRFQMNREEMTARLVHAVEHPATRFLGHWTGRLLLGRPGYDFDTDKVIEACHANDVAIELNANPARLDFDWRFGRNIRDTGAVIAISPDAHSVEGLQDTRWGVRMARKGLFSNRHVINARNATEVEKWLARKH